MGSQVDGRLEHRYKASKGSEKAKMPKQVTKEKPKSQLQIAGESKIANKPASAATALDGKPVLDAKK